MKHTVLQLVGSFAQGGSERQAIRLARSLHESGRFRVRVAALEGSGVLRAEVERMNLGGDIPEFPLTSFYDWQMARQLFRFAGFLRRERVQIVHTHDFYTNIFGITGARLAGVPVRIASRRETVGVRTARQRQIENFIFRFASGIVANAEAVRREVIAEGAPARKVVTVYNGLDFARLEAQQQNRREAKLAQLEEWKKGGVFGGGAEFVDEPVVTIVANMRLRVKDHPMFLRMARRVHERQPRALFVLAGEGELLAELRSLAAEYGLQDRAIFTGRCTNVGALLRASDVCVLSSIGEGFSNAILEYMAASRPVVATDVGGVREAIIDGETGYIVPSGNDEAMAERIVELLVRPERGIEMGERGRRIVEEKFSVEAQLARVESLYDELLGGASAVPLRNEAREAF